MGFDEEFGAVQHGEPVDDVGAEVGVYVARSVFARPLSVPRPVGEVTDHLRQKQPFIL